MSKQEELIKKITTEVVNNDDVNKVKLAITDIDGILRGKYVHKDKFKSILEGGFGFCDVVFGWDSNDVSYDNSTVTGWHTGYPDAKVALDLGTYRKVPWDNNVPFFLGNFEDENNHRLEVCPRNVLRNVKEKAHKLGFTPLFSQEFEWFNFNETSSELHERSFLNPKPLTNGMFGYSLIRASQNKEYFNDLFDLMEKFNVPVEGLHTETGPGVYEAAILYSDILEAADRAVLFKTGAKEIGHLHNVMPTFMAKWSDKLPGCSGHIHQSLWDSDAENNLFYDSNTENKMSPLMESYLAGQLHCLPEILPLYAPTINSFKRLVEGAWAPTTLTWGIDNRTTAIRALPGSPKSTRIEMRVPGSDCNPYLAMAASLASGLYGIEKGLKLTSSPVTGNGYKSEGLGRLPKSLEIATQKMKESKIANDMLGENFVQHFVGTREWECRAYDNAVTDWELKRYFEII